MQFGVTESILHWGRYRCDCVAVRHNGAETTYGELDACVSAVCSGIVEADTHGRRVATAATSKFRSLVALLAVLRAGKSVVPLNVGLPDDAIRTNLEDTEVGAILHDEDHRSYVGLCPGKPMRGFSIEGLMGSARDRSSVRFPSCAPDDEWGVLFTSGTTGVPKGIERSQYSMVTEILGWCLELELNRGSCFYIGRPVFYTGGLVLAFAALSVGGALVLNDYADYNDSEQVWGDYQVFCRDHAQPAWAFFVPDQLRAFTRYALQAGGAVNGASTVLVMGAPITGDEKLAAASAMRCKIVESWGNSESLGTITEPDDLRERPDSIGRPFLTDELCIVDHDGELLPPNTLGRIAGSEEAGFLQYCNRPEETERVKRRDLIISDDIGWTDEEGYFFVRGRDQETVVVGSETHSLLGLDAVLRTHGAITDCRVVALDGGDAEAKLGAVVVLGCEEPRETKPLLDELNSLMPNDIRLGCLRFVQSLPKVPSGKVSRLECKKMLESRE